MTALSCLLVAVYACWQPAFVVLALLTVLSTFFETDCGNHISSFVVAGSRATRMYGLLLASVLFHSLLVKTALLAPGLRRALADGTVELYSL